MTDCIFCKIITGEIPSYQVYENDLFLGFLNIQPLNPGHLLLIPKIHYRWVYDVPQFDQYWLLAKKITQAIIKSQKADFVSFLTVGLEVTHAHIHIIPRFLGDAHPHGIDTTQIQKIDSATMAKIALSIKNNLK